MAAITTRLDAITWTLGAGVADTLQFLDTPGVAFIKIVNLDATNMVWVRRDGSVATVEGAGCMPVPPGNGSLTVTANGSAGASAGSVPATISVISVAAAKVCAIKATRPYL